MDKIFRTRTKRFDESVESLRLHNVFICDSAPLGYDVLSKLESMTLTGGHQQNNKKRPTGEQQKKKSDMFYERNDFFSSYFKSGEQGEGGGVEQDLNNATLFSALVGRKVPPSQSRNQVEGVRLEMPDLPSDRARVKWQVPTSSEYEWINYAKELQKTSLNHHQLVQSTPQSNKHDDRKRSVMIEERTEDEGFCSIKSSPSTSRDDQLWDQMANYSLSDYIDWDMRNENKVLIRGLNEEKERQNKKYLLIDSPSHVFDQFYYYYLSTVYTVMGHQSGGSRKKTGRVVIEQKQYVYDCLNVLLSVQSSTFPFNKDQSRFEFNTRYHITGMSSEALHSYSEEYALTGTNHKLLLDFVDAMTVRHSLITKTTTTTSMTTGGSVLRAFGNALRVYLNFFHQIVIDELDKQDGGGGGENEFSIVSLYAHFKPYMNQIRFLVEICDLKPSQSSSATNRSTTTSSLDSMPKGLDLIFHLFKLTRETVNYTFKFHILVHLLSYCLVPFFKFIESWIFDGKYCDLFDEFLVDVNAAGLGCRDRTYYQRAYNLKDKYKRLLEATTTTMTRDYDNNQQQVDTRHFLSHLYQSIFECGRNLALLKLIDSNNVLCNQNRLSGDDDDGAMIITRPRLIVNMNLSYLQQVDQTCQSYSSQIRSRAKYHFKTRKEYMDEQKLTRQRVMTRMQAEAAERLRKYEEKVNEEKRAERERKNLEFDRLKEQLEVEMRRKKAEKDKEKELDREYMSKLMSREVMLTEEQRRMEKEIKEEMTREYQEMMTRAEKKEQTALRHVEQVKRRIEAIEQVENVDIEMMSNNEQEEERMDVSDEIHEESGVVAARSDTEQPPAVVTVEEEATAAQTVVIVEEASPIIRRVNDQSVEKEYKPSIRVNKQSSSSTQQIGGNQELSIKPVIKLNEAQHASKETDPEKLKLDEQRKIDVFKSRNLHGRHSGDSQIQNLIYSNEYANSNTTSTHTVVKSKQQQPKQSSNSSTSSSSTIKQSSSSSSSSASSIGVRGGTNNEYESQVDADQRLTLEKFIHFTSEDKRVESIDFDQIVRPYDKQLDHLFTTMHRDQMISSLFGNRFALLPSSFVNKEFNDDFESELRMEPPADQSRRTLHSSFAYEYISIDEILNRILYKPIQTQLDLVNKSMIAHFLFDLKLDEHLAALRSYMFFENGEFAQTFVDHLLTSKGFEEEEQRHHDRKIHNVTMSPILINEAFNKAVSRVIKTCKYADNLSIRIDLAAPASIIDNDNSLMSFIDQFELVYKLTWPLNIIVNEASMRSYNQVFRFLLQIKLVLSVLNSVWHTVKRLTLVNKIGESRQIRQIRLFCHEMQHYLSALQSYIYNQVIQVAWDELQTRLNDAECLDDLIEIHSSYLRNTLAKCFFTKKAEAVLSVIQNILKLIVKFRAELVAEQLVENRLTGDYEHSMFELLVETYEEFKKKSLFLYKILQKTVSVGHEFHLNNLALTLNYNDYYQQQI